MGNPIYRLPECLGGGEYESGEVHGDQVAFDLPGFPDRIWLPRSVLTEVKPPIDTANDFLFGIRGTGDDAIIAPTLPVGPMNRATALRAAAWLAVIADPGGEQFAEVLAAVRST